MYKGLKKKTRWRLKRKERERGVLKRIKTKNKKEGRSRKEVRKGLRGKRKQKNKKRCR